ncbi:4-(cytidine 5'-diphospho)-2-C-methyl-D-erythritol kinase [Cyclobacterium jeungdonense]|uniref:4-diphosphocytidyl-2-C-methyl-D-erythritol kinase n=1 Tax=Cyclobacterium jeungdonense TaxID=708087 RepID=A0ABT8C2W7_9BACT|nr:4-(cytidine 5'-diphospho)-2-C-methyl-D-erythritol kinase [Cyclobacterium jeungdonense]MDN3687114.1 4-(cytidine 5'-diphospho)-2-C-methyl-D-erythritol kinase [Cyclobacterium jeungdonense]
MISFPNAKINLGLHILNKRSDGFHEIQSCLFPIPLTDALEIIPSTSTSFSSSGITIPGNNTDNLILKAYHLIAADFPDISPIAAHLHKCIPIGAGLGGGSSNAAFALKMLNEIFNLDLNDQKLMDYAGKLGSDCPFFIRNEPQLASGRGELLEKVQLDLAGNWLILIHPGIHVSTREAYAGVKPGPAEKKLADVLATPLSWQSDLHNDFEKSIFSNHTEIAAIKHTLNQAGAWYAAMSGSGSAVFGLFENEPKNLAFPKKYFCFSRPLS